MKRQNWFWGVVLVCVGALLLLDNLGLLAFLNISAWQLIFALFLIGLGGWILWASTQSGISYDTEALSIPLEGAEEAHVRIDFGAGELKVRGAADADTLLSGTCTAVEHRVTREGAKARVKLSSPTVLVTPWNWVNTYRRTWTLALSDTIPLSITVHTGASDNKIDLSALRVTRLKIDAGASSTTVTLPARAGFTEVRGSTGAASLDIIVPQGVAARIHTSSALASVSVDRNRFPKTANGYQSPDYDTATNKANISFDIGVGSISIQ